MTSKERAFLRAEAHPLDPIVHIGKEALSAEVVGAIDEALAARELIKVGVLKNCFDDPKEMAQILSERTHSEVVRVIGRKIILYRAAKKPVIKLPQ